MLKKSDFNFNESEKLLKRIILFKRTIFLIRYLLICDMIFYLLHNKHFF